MRLIFMGTPESAVPALTRCLEDGHEVVAVWTQPDRPAGRGNKLRTPPVKEFALAHGLPVHQPVKIRTDEALALFNSHEADAAVVVAYGRILPSGYLRAPRRGCINVHFSLLPKFRGAAPVNWAIIRGAGVTGVSTMLIDEGLDTGPVLLQRETPIDDTENAEQLLRRLSHVGAELLSETLAQIDRIEPQPQDARDATLAPNLKREDGLIDWTLDAPELERRVRGLQPWPNAHTFLKGRRVVIWSVEPIRLLNERSYQAAPGELLAAEGDQLIVACGGRTALALHEVQLEGKQRTSARDFVNGTRARAGERFG